jgi:hypothetical protein
MMTKTANTHVSNASATRLEAIRSVALRMFVNEGDQAVSLRQLAEHAGLQAEKRAKKRGRIYFSVPPSENKSVPFFLLTGK